MGVSDGFGRRLRRLRTAQGRADARYGISRKILNPVLQPFGFVVVADHFYQPLLTDRAEGRRAVRHRRISSLDEGTDAAATLLDEILGTFATAFTSPQGPGRFGYSAATSQLGPGDQEVLFAYLRHLRPRRVVEVGAGGSTLIIASALALNDDDASFVSVDPFPPGWLVDQVDAISEIVDFELHTTGLHESGSEATSGLAAGDVLFVDSSHVYKPGSDVEIQFLDLYPGLADGVILHIHDIFLPGDYPASWNRRYRRYWNEQYVLQAVLANSDRFEVTLPLAHLADTRRTVFERRLPGFTPESDPGSMWLRIHRRS